MSDNNVIEPVQTSVAAFIGRASRGPVNMPVHISSFAAFHDWFGDLWPGSLLGFAVRDFFENGGRFAIVVRLINEGSSAMIDLGGGFILKATSEGSWGVNLRAIVSYEGVDDPTLFNLTVRDLETGFEERYFSLSRNENHDRFVDSVLQSESLLVHSDSGPGANRPDAIEAASDAFPGSDGQPLTSAQFLAGDQQGLSALDAVTFNLLVIPPYLPSGGVDPEVVAAAARYCEQRQAFLILDPPPEWTSMADIERGEDPLSVLGTRSPNAAVYFPRLIQPDPFHPSSTGVFPASGAIAGVMARLDKQQGVWKAPAGHAAVINGALDLSSVLSDAKATELNQRSINCLRDLAPQTAPAKRLVVWGARTLAGGGKLQSDWQYVNVRRFALFLHESIRLGTQWVVFEPNDEALWEKVRNSVSEFMLDHFREGAFQGSTPREAFFVKCGREVLTGEDIEAGVLTIVVGFAPLRPAEFVVLSVRQLMATNPDPD